MQHTVKVLVVDKDRERGPTLPALLPSMLTPGEVDQVSALHEAIFSINEEKYDVILIFDLATEAEFDTFFADFGKIPQTNRGVCIRVKEKFDPSTTRVESKRIGFDTGVGLNIDEDQKSDIGRVYQERFRIKEVHRRVMEVDESLTLLLRDLDRAAINKKRGAKNYFDKIAQRLVVLHTEFGDDVLEAYVEHLSNSTQDAKPISKNRLEIPDEIIKKCLPGMVDGQYTGRSLRVFQRLLRLYGKEG